MSDLVKVRITSPFFDAQKERRREPSEGVVEETAKRARDFVAIGCAEIVEDAATEKKAQSPPPQNKSLTGPPENKDVSADENSTYTPLEDLTVAELEEVAAERGLDLGNQYIKKADLIDLIRRSNG